MAVKDNVVQLSAARAEAGAKAVKSLAPLAEAPVRGKGEPVWVYTSDPRITQSVFSGIARVLREKGFSVDDDTVQSDPMEGLRTLGFFEVRFYPLEQREPEELGIVSLYGKDGKTILKMNPAFPGAETQFIEALGPALSASLKDLVQGSPDVQIQVGEGKTPDFF